MYFTIVKADGAVGGASGAVAGAAWRDLRARGNTYACVFFRVPPFAAEKRSSKQVVLFTWRVSFYMRRKRSLLFRTQPKKGIERTHPERDGWTGWNSTACVLDSIPVGNRICCFFSAEPKTAITTPPEARDGRTGRKELCALWRLVSIRNWNTHRTRNCGWLGGTHVHDMSGSICLTLWLRASSCFRRRAPGCHSLANKHERTWFVLTPSAAAVAHCLS